MPTPNSNTIVIKGDLQRRREQWTAGGTITPGHLIRKSAANTVAVHNTSAGYAQRIFAVEDSIQGRTISDNYVTGEPVQCHYAQPGDIVLGLLASGVNAADGITLISNGDGTLRLVTGSEKEVIGYADEAVDNTGGLVPRIRVRVA